MNSSQLDQDQQRIFIDGQMVSLVALQSIFQEFHGAGKLPCDLTACELLERVSLYNLVPAGAIETYAMTILREYARFCAEERSKARSGH